MNWFFESLGIKRKIAAFIAVVLAIVSTHPQFQFILPYITWLGGLVGVTGLVHAAAKGTLGAFKTLSWASLFTTLLAFAQTIPALHPYIPTLLLLASLFGVTGLAISKKGVKARK